MPLDTNVTGVGYIFPFADHALGQPLRYVPLLTLPILAEHLSAPVQPRCFPVLQVVAQMLPLPSPVTLAFCGAFSLFLRRSVLALSVTQSNRRIDSN